VFNFVQSKDLLRRYIYQSTQRQSVVTFCSNRITTILYHGYCIDLPIVLAYQPRSSNSLIPREPTQVIQGRSSQPYVHADATMQPLPLTPPRVPIINVINIHPCSIGRFSHASLPSYLSIYTTSLRSRIGIMVAPEV
jgi:hypothetical protein